VAQGTADERRLVAYIAGQAGSQPANLPGTAELRRWLAGRLPSYMLPEVVVPLEQLPVNRSGKVDRTRLPAPPATRPESAQPFAAPASATERRLAAIWTRVLGLEQVGTGDSFFDLGGNSVRMLAVLTALTAPAGTGDPDAITLVDLFRYPTIASLAAWLDNRGGQTNDSSVARHRGRRRRELLAARSADRADTQTIGIR
jgi:hypothetical protein